MAEIKKFPINTIDEFASTTTHGLANVLYYNNESTSSILGNGIPSNSNVCPIINTPSQRAVTSAIIDTFNGKVHTTHAEYGYKIDANTVSTPTMQIVDGKLLKNRTISAQTADEIQSKNVNTFYVKYGKNDSPNVDDTIYIGATMDDSGEMVDMWEGDNDNKLYKQVPNIIEVFTFDNSYTKKTVRYGARKNTPMKCYKDIGSTAGNDYSAIMNNDLAVDINYLDGEYMKIINRALPLFQEFGTGSFTLSIKFNTALPIIDSIITSNTTLIPLFKCVNANGTGITATFKKILKNKWGLEVKVNFYYHQTQARECTFTYDAENIFDGNRRTLTIVSKKNDNDIVLSAHLNSDSTAGFTTMNATAGTSTGTSYSHPDIILWSNDDTVPKPIDGFVVCPDKNYSGAIDDLYFFNYGFDIDTVKLLHNARFIGPQETRLLKSVQGGIYQKTAIVIPQTSINSPGKILFTIKPGEIIGKIFIKALAPGMPMFGQRYSIGVDSDHEKFVKNIDFYYEENQIGLLEMWYYGNVFSNLEMYYATTEETVKLYMTDYDTEYTPPNSITSQLAVTMFYDTVVWSPYKFYTMGHLSNTTDDNTVMRLNLNTETLEYSVRCTGIINTFDYGIAEWNKYVFCAGGLSSVVEANAPPIANSAYNDYTSSIYKYDTTNDSLSPMIRCQLSSERRNASRIGLVNYSMCAGYNRIYFFGGCINHGMKNTYGVYESDYYQTLDTIDKFNPNIDTLNAIPNAKMSTARVGSTSYMKDDVIYTFGGFTTIGGKIVKQSDAYYYNLESSKVDMLTLVTDTSSTSVNFTSGCALSGVSKMKISSPNKLLYLVGGVDYSNSSDVSAVGKSLSNCIEIQPTVSIAAVSSATLVYPVSRACCGQDNRFGWIIGGEQLDVSSFGSINIDHADGIKWSTKFEFSTKTFSVSNTVMPKYVNGDSGTSIPA